MQKIYSCGDIYDIYLFSARHLLYLIQVNDFQRLLDDDHVAEIYDYQMKIYKETGKFEFTTAILLGQINNTYYILDGQHRVACIQLLLKKVDDFDIICNVYKRDDEKDLYKIYNTFNSSKPVKLYNTLSESIILKRIEKHLVDNYKTYIKKTDNPLVPNFNCSKFIDNIKKHDILSKLQIISAKHFIDLMESLNSYYSSLDDEALKVIFPDNYHKIEKVDKTKILFLVFFKKYEWLGNVYEKEVDKVEYCEQEHLLINKHRKITKSNKIKLWDCKFGDTKKGTCYCCEEKISYDDFEATHKISYAFGGTNELNNLEIVCKSCNRDKGIRNIEDFKKDF